MNQLVPLTGPYLGQKEPGMTPEIFAPGIISTGKYGEAGSVFANNGNMFIFNRYKEGESYTIYCTELKDGIWTTPCPAPFNSDYNDWDYNIAPDGRTLFFTSKRPVDDSLTPSRYGKIWKTILTTEGWTEPELLNAPINTENSHDSYASLTKNGTLYFFSDRDGNIGDCDIFRAKQVGGKYPEIENLGPQINTVYNEYDLYVDPDERYLIFCSTRPGGYSDADLYISFYQGDDTWREPINLGEMINSHGAVCPSVTADQRFFYFHSRRRNMGDIYWLDASFIDDIAQANGCDFLQ